MTICPECGDEKERIAQHWAMSACGYPEISREQREVLNGLMLAGATVAGNGSNRNLTIGTTSEALAEWTAEQLDWLHHGSRVDDGDGNREDVYRIRTPAHPACNRYERWGDDGEGRAPPDDYQLTARAGRVWWAYAGGLQWHGEYDSNRTATISALDESRARWVQRVLETAGINATRAGKRVQWHGDQLREWLDWTGERVPGAEYKWAEVKLAYRAWADVSEGVSHPPQSDSKDWYTAEDCARHLVQAVQSIGEPIGQIEYAEWARGTGAPSMDTVRDRLGSGSWPDACSAVGVTAAGEFDITYDDFLDVLVEIRETHGTWPKTTEYDDLRPSDSPSLAQVYKYTEHDGWEDAIKRAKQR